MYRKQTDAACPTKKDKTEHNFLTERITLQHSKEALYSKTLRRNSARYVTCLSQSDTKSKLNTGYKLFHTFAYKLSRACCFTNSFTSFPARYKAAFPRLDIGYASL